MRGNVVVDTESDYQAWLQKQRTFAQLSAPNSLKKASLDHRGEPDGKTQDPVRESSDIVSRTRDERGVRVNE
jgi:heme/copper-type cytochrome/quinol oxidase subunit 2